MTMPFPPGPDCPVIGQRRGSYVIISHVDTSRTIRVGKLGEFLFRRGHLAYVGSAFGFGGLASRIRHHLRGTDRPHWHADYLHRAAKPEEAWISEQEDRREHNWASILDRWDATEVPAPGFGSSDCRCRTHLFSFPRRPSLRAFGEMVRRVYPTDQVIQRVALMSHCH